MQIAYGSYIETIIMMKYGECHCRDKGPLNTLRPRQNGRRFADDIYKRIFLNENVWIPS